MGVFGLVANIFGARNYPPPSILIHRHFLRLYPHQIHSLSGTGLPPFCGVSHHRPRPKFRDVGFTVAVLMPWQSVPLLIHHWPVPDIEAMQLRAFCITARNDKLACLWLTYIANSFATSLIRHFAISRVRPTQALIQSTDHIQPMLLNDRQEF